MQLRCKTCAAVQAVTCPDEADEDARTRAIRQAFRAAHAERCGTQTVCFDVEDMPTGLIEDDVAPWWTARTDQPTDVTLGGDGFFTRELRRDGVTQAVRVCEDCWANIPRYVDFPFGLVSPESEGDAQGDGAKTRRTSVEGQRGIEHLRKALCLPCYREAFRRVYPHAPLPDLCEDVIGDGTPVAPPAPPSDEIFIGEPAREASL